MADKTSGNNVGKVELNCHGCGACLMSGACLPGYNRDKGTVEDKGSGNVTDKS